jgi:NAD(P)-dependent dehydrogenase (short-subunit alcohol dehydrogenase family)
LDAKVALVTGFGSGLGREIALALAREGASVAGFSRGTDAGDGTAKLIADAGGTSLFVATDVRDGAQVAAGLARVVAAFGGIDRVVNAAGVRVTGTATEITEEQWDLAIDTNLKGTFLVSRACVPEMARRGGGAIVNVSSVSGLHGVPGRVAHSVSKGALHVLTEAMAADHAADGIRVNCVCPGAIETPATPLDAASHRSRLAVRRALASAGGERRTIGRAEDVTETVVYLLSDAARHVSGVVITIDGGGWLGGSA